MTTRALPAGAEHELAFWRSFVRTPRFLEGWVGAFPTPELRPLVRDFLLDRPDADVLDVGSGVVSLLRGTVPPARLTAVDSLAGEYRQLLDYSAHGLTPPFAGAAEDLAFEAAFDVVHISNALDHCQDPPRALLRLQAAVRPGGWLIVQGFEREGTHEGGAGLHQWDLYLLGRALAIVTLRGEGRLVEQGDQAHTFDLPTGRRWFVWMQRRAG